MPNNIIKSFAEKSGKSVKKVEELWDKAKEIAKKEYKDVKEDSEDFYKIVTGILKNMVGKTVEEAINLDEEVAFVSDNQRGGYDLSMEGDYKRHCRDFEEVLRLIENCEKRFGVCYSIYFVNKRGNVSPMDREGNIIEESAPGKVGRTSVKEAQEFVSANEDLIKRFRKIVVELGGKEVAKELLNNVKFSKIKESENRLNLDSVIDGFSDNSFARWFGSEFNDFVNGEGYISKEEVIEFIKNLFELEDTQAGELLKIMKTEKFVNWYNKIFIPYMSEEIDFTEFINKTNEKSMFKVVVEENLIEEAFTKTNSYYILDEVNKFVGVYYGVDKKSKFVGEAKSLDDLVQTIFKQDRDAEIYLIGKRIGDYERIYFNNRGEITDIVEESKVGEIGRTTIREAEEYIEANEALITEFKKVVKKLGGKAVAEGLLKKVNFSKKKDISDEAKFVVDLNKKFSNKKSIAEESNVLFEEALESYNRLQTNVDERDIMNVLRKIDSFQSMIIRINDVELFVMKTNKDEFEVTERKTGNVFQNINGKIGLFSKIDFDKIKLSSIDVIQAIKTYGNNVIKNKQVVIEY